MTQANDIMNASKWDCHGGFTMTHIYFYVVSPYFISKSSE